MKVPQIPGAVSIARSQLDPKLRPEDAGQANPDADKIELSTESQTAAKLAAELLQPEARAALVQQLKEQRAAGKLTVDQQQIAEAMMAEGWFDDLIFGK